MHTKIHEKCNIHPSRYVTHAAHFDFRFSNLRISQNPCIYRNYLRKYALCCNFSIVAKSICELVICSCQIHWFKTYERRNNFEINIDWFRPQVNNITCLFTYFNADYKIWNIYRFVFRLFYIYLKKSVQWLRNFYYIFTYFR